jgi:HNH endonuclease
MTKRKRKAITVRLAVDALLHRAKIQAQAILCDECAEELLPGQKIQMDHIFEHADGGPHEYTNLRPIHYDPCHKKKSAKSEKQRHHIDRIVSKREGTAKPKRKKAWAKGRKMVSRPFQKMVKA